MNDQELLELSAKAVGAKFQWFGAELRIAIDDRLYKEWNPLTDDGDALRLAVKLGLVIEVGHTARGFMVVRTNTENWQEFRELFGDNPATATRRAIVRAAAEIGKETI